MVTRNAYGIEFRHVGSRVCKDICDHSHREFRRIYICIPYHEFLQYIILDRSVKFRKLCPLLESCNNIKSHYRKNCAIHRHRHRHLIQRNLVEKYLHIKDRIDCNSCFADISPYSFVVGIIPPVGRQVECNRETFLPGSQVAPVKSI